MFNEALINKFGKLPTPFYYYDISRLAATLQQVKKESERYHYHVHYALKANANEKILGMIREHGFGADCVSGNEVKRSIGCNFTPDNIVFAGVGKSDQEINYSLEQDIFCFNCESVQELEVINELAQKQNKKARIALRINPNVNANTHKYITTGLEENKFGINPYEFDMVLDKLKGFHHLQLTGLHFHIGSQISELGPFKNLCTRVNEIQDWFQQKGYELKVINVGGGLGINYKEPDTAFSPDFEAYFKIFHDFLEVRKGQHIHFELGRALVGQCGNLISRVLYIKKGINTNFAILDAGMTELIRPALYQAYHKIENLSALAEKLSETTTAKRHTARYDIVGPICESSDCFGKAVYIPETYRNDLMAIRSAGAYGEVMTSSYNLRDKAPVIYSDELH
jgi:diaminopimelate decarboxylase